MTDPQKWEDPFFQGLTPQQKLVWLYVIDRCDFCGFWRPNGPLTSFQIGESVDLDAALKAFGDRVQVINGKWFIRKFARFQHGDRILKAGDKLAVSFDKCLSYHDLDRVSIGYEYATDTVSAHADTVKDKDRGRDKGRNKDKSMDEREAYGPHVRLTPDEFKALTESVTGGEPQVQRLIESMNDYLAAGRKKPYKDFSAAIRNWARRDGLLKTALAGKVDYSGGV
jgi:hypothetical protein